MCVHACVSAGGTPRPQQVAVRRRAPQTCLPLGAALAAVFTLHTRRGASLLPPAPSLRRAPARGGMSGAGFKAGLGGEEGVRRQEMLIRSRVKQPPPSGLQVGSVQAQAVTGRRENYIIPCSSDATFRAATMRAGKQPGARLTPPRPARCHRGGGGGSCGAGRSAPASLTLTHTPARVFTALTQAYCDVS